MFNSSMGMFSFEDSKEHLDDRGIKRYGLKSIWDLLNLKIGSSEHELGLYVQDVSPMETNFVPVSRKR